LVGGCSALTYTWDDEDRLTSVALPGGVVDTFTYNGLGLRVGKQDSTGTYAYVCDGTSPGAPVLSDAHAVYNPGLSEYRAGVVTYSDNDASGDSTPGGCLYTAFGTPVLTSAGLTTPFRYGGGNGCQTDADTGLVLMGHRYYDSRIGRFLTQDPAGDGDNWYAYADNDPVDNADPEGLWVPQNGEWSVNGGAMSDAASAFGQVQSDSLSSFSTYNSVVQQYLWQKTDYHDGNGPQLTGEWPIASWMLGGGGAFAGASKPSNSSHEPTTWEKIQAIASILDPFSEFGPSGTYGGKPTIT